MALRIANAPVSWGIEPPNFATDPPWQILLGEVAAAGYDGCELGPLGYMTTVPDELAGALDHHGLYLAAGFVMEPLGVRGERDRIDALTRDTCRLLAACGAETLVLMDAVADDRDLTAGRPDVAARLDGPARQRLVDGVRRVSNIAHDEFGLRTAVHPHVGTHIEFEDEIEHLLAAVDPAELALCLDTAHSVYAAVDPVALLKRHGGRVGYLHLKDIDDRRLARVRGERSSFRQAVAAGVFRPLGHGCVDFDAVAASLRELSYEGWATVEQDRLPGRSTSAREEAALSLQFLHQVRLV